MKTAVSALPLTTLLRTLAAVFVGLGIGRELNASVALPAVAAGPGIAVGADGLLVGAARFTKSPPSHRRPPVPAVAVTATAGLSDAERWGSRASRERPP